MDKQPERQPLDDFFDRKLKEASVTPSDKGWGRLQSRLTQTEQKSFVSANPQHRIGSWVYGVASAIAACILLILLWPNDTKKIEGSKIVATHYKPKSTVMVPKTPANETGNSDLTAVRIKQSLKESMHQNGTERDEAISRYQPTPATQLPAEKAGKPVQEASQILATSDSKSKPSEKLTDPTGISLRSASPEPVNAASPTAHVEEERTLIVKVAEPAQIENVMQQADRSTKDQTNPANDDKPTRITRVFQQIKRFKEGEATARASSYANESDEEGGLFNRIVRSTRYKDTQEKSQK